MFDNVGGKIKIAAKVVAWIGIIFCVIYGFVLLVSVEGMALAGLLVMILGSLGSWLSSLLVYGFGELIENSAIIAHKKELPANEPQRKKNDVIDKWLNDGLITEEEYNAKKNGDK